MCLFLVASNEMLCIELLHAVVGDTVKHVILLHLNSAILECRNFAAY